MKAITFSAIKGGVGKTSIAILFGRYLIASGFKVLFIDMDIQNSLSFYCSSEENDVKYETYNIANALMNGKLKENIITNNELNFISSSLNLTKLRGLGEKTLLNMRPQIENDFDYCIIDTPPTYDSLVLNAINFSDIIVTPISLSLFDFKSLNFLKAEIETETTKINNWKILFNKYKESRSDNPDTELNQYKNLFTDNFNNILNTKIIDTAHIQKAIDFKVKITEKEPKTKLYNSILGLANELLNIKNNVKEF